MRRNSVRGRATADTARRRTPSDQVSAAILSAAETVLDREGSAGVTIRAVAREAAVAPMSVYNRFDSKEGLLSALAMRALDELAGLIAVPDHADPIDRFKRACRQYRRFALTHTARYLLIFTAGSPLRDQAGAPAQHGRAAFDQLIGLTVAVTGRRDDAPFVKESAQAVWSAVHGAVTIEQTGIGQTADYDTTFEHLLDLLVHGLQAG